MASNAPVKATWAAVAQDGNKDTNTKATPSKATQPIVRESPVTEAKATTAAEPKAAGDQPTQGAAKGKANEQAEAATKEIGGASATVASAPIEAQEVKKAGEEAGDDKNQTDEEAQKTSLLEKARLGLQSTFENAVHFIQHGSRLDIPHEQQIHMTALLKQATRGDCACEEEPCEAEAKEGWQAWCSLKGTSRTEAMKEYVKLLTTWKSDWETPEGEKTTEGQSLTEKASDMLHGTFDRAAHFVKHGTKLDLSEEQQTKMGALLKQATIGDCNAEDPKLKEENPAAVSEWCNLKGTSRIDAMKEYIKMLATAKSDWEQSCEGCPQKEGKACATECQEKKSCEKSEKIGQGKQQDKGTAEQQGQDANADKCQGKKSGECQKKEAESEGSKNEAKACTTEAKDDGHDATILQKTFDTVKSTFDKCAHYVQRGLNFRMPEVDRSKAEALFKQATQGDVAEEEPSEEADKEKWNSWNTLKGMDKKEAMKQYIKLLTSSKSEWEECERLAKDAERVAALMKDLDIQEEACAACHPDLSKRDRKAEAYIHEKQESDVATAQQREQVLAGRQ